MRAASATAGRRQSRRRRRPHRGPYTARPGAPGLSSSMPPTPPITDGARRSRSASSRFWRGRASGFACLIVSDSEYLVKGRPGMAARMDRQGLESEGRRARERRALAGPVAIAGAPRYPARLGAGPQRPPQERVCQRPRRSARPGPRKPPTDSSASRLRRVARSQAGGGAVS
jgi:hypothetical protein